MQSPSAQAVPTSPPPAAPGSGRRARVLAAIAAAIVAIGALGGVAVLKGRQHPAAGPVGPTSSPAGPQGSTSGSPDLGVKAPMQGLVQENAKMPDEAAAGLLGGIVVIAPWSELQPEQGGPIAADNPIDGAIDTARTFNAAHPDAPVSVKIRVFAGTGAPDWAKTLDGFRPVAVTNIQSGQSGTVGPFWTPGYGAAYADLQQKLAARYDTEPLVRDVTISRCMTVFAEPFQRDVRDAAGFLDQGYTVEADKSCLLDQIDAHTVWKHTHQSLSFNPYKPWQAGQGGVAARAAGGDTQFPLAVMDRCRKALGPLCTLENNSIRSGFIGLQSSSATELKPQRRQYGTMYAALQRLGPAITLQTAGPKDVGDLHATVQWGISLGANSVEIPKRYDVAAMRIDNAALLANPSGTP